MFYHGYNNYLNLAFPLDELRPLTCDGYNTWGSYSLTLLDSMGTLLVMGNTTEFARVVNWVVDNISFNKDLNVSVFETNIRVLGSLLSAHLFITESKVVQVPGYNNGLLNLAIDLGKRMIPAFRTPTMIPYGTVNLKYGVPPGETPITCTAGGGTFGLEFGILSALTNDTQFETAAKEAAKGLWSYRSQHGLVGNHINTFNGEWTLRDAGIGQAIDSFYEYLLKASIYFGDKEYYDLWNEAYEGAMKNLKVGSLYVDMDMYSKSITWPTYNNLQAFWPSLQVLMGDLENASDTTGMWHLIWRQNRFSPERLNYITGRPVDASYPLRPELIESIYYLSRAMHYDDSWLEAGKDILYSIENYTRTKCGFAAVNNVEDLTFMNRMDSFFLAETLKYLYLLFDEDNWVSKGNYIFNTEAHPFPLSFKFMKQGKGKKAMNFTCPASELTDHSMLFFETPKQLYNKCSRFLEDPNADKPPPPPLTQQDRKPKRPQKPGKEPRPRSVHLPEHTGPTISDESVLKTFVESFPTVHFAVAREQSDCTDKEACLNDAPTPITITNMDSKQTITISLEEAVANLLKEGNMATKPELDLDTSGIPTEDDIKIWQTFRALKEQSSKMDDMAQEWKEFMEWKEFKEWQEFQEWKEFKKWQQMMKSKKKLWYKPEYRNAN